jgi:hypothetical protein
MSLRLVPLALLLGTYSALAFDTSKLGQWGSLFLDDLAPVTAKSSRLQQEINEVLSNANKKEEEGTLLMASRAEHLGASRESI